MKRKEFLQNLGLGVLSAAAVPTTLLGQSTVVNNKDNETIDGYNEEMPPLNDGNSLNKVLGLGGVPLAGAWKPTSEEDSLKTLEKAWELGIRYYDTSPRYGNGISERRFGVFLDGKPSDKYILSSKVGRILKPGVAPKEQIKHLWKNPMNAVFNYDYTASGARKSIEDSLLRLGVQKLDFVFIHDLNPANFGSKEEYQNYFEEAKKGAIPELAKMKEEGIIKGWGFGINQPDAVLEALNFSQPDICLMATQYSLLDHKQALNKTFPTLQKNKVKIVLGSPLNCGYLAGNETWNYSPNPAPKEIAEKRKQLQAVAAKYSVDLRTAALQFAMAHPAVVSVLTGCRNAEQIYKNFISLHGNEIINKAFWGELKALGLIEKNAPTPTA
ncbi:aldo/keto reductase [Riemerella anatipestifer]|nr:aldo/keto reductase [Riemerella anatipestifer]MDY3324238.1 aldo/keto reductase [Riemerella anatipestifer]MDY3353053.1 aldo/keto reductase [Riemerella anatipestifer]